MRAASLARPGGRGSAGSLELGSSTEFLLGVSSSSIEVLLGESGSGADGVEHLLLHLGAGRLGGETEALDLGSSGLGIPRNLGGNAHVHGSLGLGVKVLQLGLSLGHALLTDG